ncbi:MAG: hypothetical protein RIQ72_460 [Candidatus Parcubacteria bacterium]|jgi:hypothetical protein
MTTFFLTLILGFVFYASLIEWLLHRYVMHKPIFGFKYAYEAHAKVHHRVYKADGTYHEGDRQPPQKHLIPMAWWNSPVLVAIGSTPFFFISLAMGNWAIYLGIVLALGLYYAVYEYFHWCMHLPKKRRVTYTRPIRWYFRLINGHHLLHHKYMGKNFNVVLPIWDLLLGTLVRRAKVPFEQPRDPLLPDLQPRPASPK